LRKLLVVTGALAAALLTVPPAALAAPTRGSADPNAVAPTYVPRSCGNGGSAITTVPAKGFNPLTATAAELEANDYPPRPARSDRQDYATWRKFVLSPNATVSTCPDLSLSPRQGSPTTGGRIGGGGDGGPNDNWAGYQTSSTGYTDVQSEWHLPVARDSGSNSYYSSTWVGLGDGYGPYDELIQAGSESDWIGGVGSSYYLWYEFFPEAGQTTIYGPFQEPKPGDLIYVHVHYAGGKVSFHIEDETTGFNWHPPAKAVSFSSVGDAEWIYERTEKFGGLPYLANAQTTFAYSEAANSSGWHPLISLPLYDYSMWSCSPSRRMAYASAIDGSSFHSTFENAGDNDKCAL